MGVNYQSLESTARRLIKENGRAMVVRELIKSGPAHNPVITPDDKPAVGVMTEFDAHERDDSFTNEDKKVLIGAVFDIDKTMKLVDEGLAYSIVNVRKIKPGSVTVLYILQVRL